MEDDTESDGAKANKLLRGSGVADVRGVLDKGTGAPLRREYLII